DNGGDQGMGWDFGGTVDYGLTGNLCVGVDGAYNASKSKDQPVAGVDLKAKTTNYGVHGNWFIPTGGKVMPYIGAGVGYYNRKIEEEGSGATLSTSKGGFGANGGVGIAYPLSGNLGIGVDGRYHWTNKDSFSSGGPKVNWSFMTFNVVLGWSFSPGM